MRDILDAPRLRMRLLHGDDAELQRPVARVCATDMPDPRPFVTPGALVCTGLIWRTEAGDSERYVRMLADAGAVGVVAGRALHGHVPEDVVAACERHGLPLLSAPPSVPFSRIIEYLAEQAADTRWRRVRSRADRQRRLLDSVAAGSTMDELLTDIAAEQDISAWLVTSTGTVITGTEELSSQELDRIVATALGAPRLPAVTTGAMRVLQVGAGDRITAWYLVFRPADPDPEPFGPDLAAVAELYRQRRIDRLRLDWELADRIAAPFPERPGVPMAALVCEIHATGTVPLAPPQPAHMALERDCDASAVALLEDTSTSTSRMSAGLAAVRAAVHDAIPGVSTAMDREGRLIGVVTGTQDEIAAVVRRRIGRLAPALDGVRLAFGVGAQQRDEPLSGAVAAATAAATAARDDAAAVSVRIADIDSAVGLFTAVPGGLQRRFAERVLGPVLDYDRKTGAGLLETLEVFLACEGSWRQAADRMRVHLNTVRYRIGRIEELTGRDLGRLDDRLDLYLAVRTIASLPAVV
ncbi:PucR family transcriptional regulator [Nocardia jejuensis]|uniref:PucR family transcriptional regulator n=1 Tax=Nocardia jejuensis TaxID=328049 RepID=UPI001FE022A2|nr:PucR family transcriptional regulator [Nocardia jejuensis]